MYICSTRNNITKSIETIIEVADESVLPAIESIVKISGFMKGYLSIQDEYEVLTNRVNSRHMTLAERELAFKKVKELRTDREAFIGLSTIITLVTLNIGTGSMATPALVLSLLLGGLNETSSFFYDLRVANIFETGKGHNTKMKWIIDPSGFAYEGVTSNRLQNVKTTLYYKKIKLLKRFYGIHMDIIKLIRYILMQIDVMLGMFQKGCGKLNMI